MILAMIARRRDISHDTDGLGNTPFHYAAMHGQSAALDQLLALYPDGAHTKNLNGDSLLHLAVMNGSEKSGAVCFLLEGDPSLLAIPDHHGRTAVHVAAGAGNLHLLEVFYEKDRQCLGWTDNMGCLPAHFSAANGQTAALEWMRERQEGCLLAKDREGRACYEHAEQHSQVFHLCGSSS